MLSDDGLVREAQAGRPEAFDSLMRRDQRLVCRVALNYVSDTDSALDVTQTVFLKAFRRLEDVRAEGMFKPWSLRITHNESVNWLRKRRRAEAGEDAVDLDRQPAAAAGPEAQAARREQQSLVLDGLSGLNPKYRTAVALRYAEGLRICEIADTMGCSEGMLKSLLFRGVRQLRDHVTRAVDGRIV